MSITFNLLDQPWVPCITAMGDIQELSLRQALVESHTVREVNGETPLVTAALYRLLLAVVHRVIAPGDDTDVWDDLWSAGRPPADSLHAYLDAWQHRFDLFAHERPFYQHRHPKAKPKSVISLVFDMSSGNNPTLFDHHSEDLGVSLSPAEAARALIAAQTFGLGGLSPVSGERFTDGPAARGITFLVQGETLWQTLLLNLIPYPVPYIMGTQQDRDRPAWENPDPMHPETRTPYGYLDYLTWQNRRVLLLPEETEVGIVVRSMLLGPGLRLEGDLNDPLKHYRRPQSDSRGWVTLRFVEQRALWRDSASLLTYTRGLLADQKQYNPPEAIGWLHWLLEEKVRGIQAHHTMRLLGLGMANDQAKVEFHRREELPLPLAYLQKQDLVSHLQQAIGEAEDAGRQLFGALSTLAVQMLFHKQEQRLSGPAKIERNNLIASWGVERLYWADLELPFHSLITDLPHDDQPARRAWALTVRKAAWRALDAAIAAVGEDPPALKAAVLARGQLGGGLHKVLQHWFPREPEEV